MDESIIIVFCKSDPENWQYLTLSVLRTCYEFRSNPQLPREGRFCIGK
jgi:hypothetical protein